MMQRSLLMERALLLLLENMTRTAPGAQADRAQALLDEISETPSYDITASEIKADTITVPFRELLYDDAGRLIGPSYLSDEVIAAINGPAANQEPAES